MVQENSDPWILPRLLFCLGLCRDGEGASIPHRPLLLGSLVGRLNLDTREPSSLGLVSREVGWVIYGEVPCVATFVHVRRHHVEIPYALWGALVEWQHRRPILDSPH